MANSPSLSLPRVRRQTIDADPSGWDLAGLFVMRLAEDSARPLRAGAFDAGTWLGWDERGLRALVEVTAADAAEAVENPRASHAFTHSSVELFLRRGSEWKHLVQLVVSPGISADQSEPRIAFWDYRGPGHAAPLTATVARVRREHGYALEMLLPWSTIGFDAKVGVECEVKISVNHRARGGPRRQRTWRAADGGDFHRLVLAEGGMTVLTAERAAWLRIDRWSTVAVNAVLPESDIGRTVSVTQAGRTVASTLAVADGDRAVAHLALPIGALTPKQPAEIACDGKQIGAGSIPDQREHARWALDFFSRDIPWYEWAAEDILPLRPSGEFVFAGPDLPHLRYPSPEVAEAAGVVATEVRFFGAGGNEVRSAEKPGRYGAILTTRGADGWSVTYHQTLFCRGRDARNLATTAVAAIELAAAHEVGSGRPRPGAQDRRWWHELRRRLGTETRYETHIAFPRGYRADGAELWPTVIYLHGGAHHYGTPAQRGPHQEIDVPLRAYPQPLIAVHAYSYGTWESPAVLDLVGRLVREHRVDPDRVILTGFSMGGYGTWQAAVDHPEAFAAIVPVGAGPGHPEDAARIRDLPTWCINGETDEATTCAEAEGMLAPLRAAGGQPRYTLLPGADHVATMNTAYADPELWAWMLTQRRWPRAT
jgi:acetyl esterase/lipase